MPISKNRSLITIRSPCDIARQYFPNEPDHILDMIIYGCTGYPCYWHDSRKSAAENFRDQLKEAQEKGWQKIYDERVDRADIKDVPVYVECFYETCKKLLKKD